MAGAALTLVAMFARSLLLIVGALPLWESRRPRPSVQARLRGITAAVVGLLVLCKWSSSLGGVLATLAGAALIRL